jgi:filamentous hemagglutinin
MYGQYGNSNVPSNSAIADAAARDQAIRQQLFEQTINAAAAAGALVVLPGAAGAAPAVVRDAVNYCMINPGACAISSGVGGALSTIADAAGQYVQNGTIRPVQSLMAGTMGAVLTPFGMNTGIAGNGMLGAINNIMNSAFQNLYYGDKNNLAWNAAVGGLAGTAGAYAGSQTQGAISNYVPIFTKPGIPALLQSPNPLPAIGGVTAGGVVQGGGSFIPPILDGKK